ncbi:MAG: ribosome maturation factor RimP [Lachnospiraceae bacterium]|nr:ribosome maturation factor RimP [Lachnospiraceae bacterium]
MAGKAETERRTEEMLAPILDEFGFILWDVEYVKEGKEYYLRVYIDKEGGITIDDCVDVSRRLSDRLDAEDLIDDAYTLEVSSPGLGRKLVKDREFNMSIGKDVDVKFYKNVDGVKEISGVLDSFDKETVTIIINDKGSPPDPRTFSRSDIATIRLSVDF